MIKFRPIRISKGVILALTVMICMLTVDLGQAQTSSAAYIQARNKINGMVLQVKANKKVKYRMAGQSKFKKGYIQSIRANSIVIDGQAIHLDQMVEIRSWAVKKPNRLPGILLTGGGALFTALGVGGLVSESGEDGYSGLTKMVSGFVAVGGSAAAYSGLRMLKRKAFFLSQWEFIPTE